MDTRASEAPGASEPLVSLVVLAWDNLPLTEKCVTSLRATTDVPYELIIVDNGSEPDAAAWARDHADRAVLHEENRGFAHGMNAGLEIARGDVVAFVNNDTVWPEGWTGPLLEHFDESATGIVVPAVTAAGNPVSVRTAPGDEAFTLDPFSELPSGVVYLLRTDVARGLGGWTDRFRVAMSEDLDLLFTAWTNGLEVVLDTRVLIEHELHASLEQLDEDRTALWRENLDAFLDRWATVTADDVDVLRDRSVVEGNVRHARAAARWLARQDELREAHNQRLAEVRARSEERIEELRSEVHRLRQQVRDLQQPGLVGRIARRLRHR